MMANKSIFITAVAILMVGGVALAQTQPSPVQPPPVKRTIVGKADVPNSNYEAITAIVEIAPGFKAGRHLHPGVVFCQVLEGEFWLALDDQPEKSTKLANSVLCRPKRSTTRALSDHRH